MYSKSMLRLALPAMLAAAVAVSAAETAQAASADARSEGPLGLRQAPMEAMAAAKVVAEVPFQKFVELTCSGNPSHCRASLPAVAEKERLVIQFASCNAVMTVAGALRFFTAAVTDAKLTKQFGGHFIAPSYQSSGALIHYVANQPLLLTVTATRVLHLEAASYTGTISGAGCGVSGLRQKLG